MAELVRDARPVSLRRGALLFSKGDPVVTCWFMLKGVVKLTVSTSQGHERILALQGKGVLVGALGLMDGQPHSTSATTLTDCHAMAISSASFADVRARHPEVERALVGILAGKLRQAADNAAWGGLLNARQRIARSVLEFASMLGEPIGEGQTVIDRAITHADIAALAFVSREEVTRTLSGWKRAGVVGTAAGQALVVDTAGLEREAADAPVSRSAG
ncbi:MAG: Crp/Fnr family transcriptional regulator [Proteobacteria bacterium]|nr:Crp/Fnr family transcriptional regulator [Pseudomonadota bacterium]